MKLKNVIFLILVGGLMFVVQSNAQSKESPNSSVKPTTEQTKDKPVKIIKKMFSGLRAANCSQSSLLATVRVTFDKSVTITNAEIVNSSGCNEFDRSVENVAKKIKFEPAFKDGEAVTVSKMLQYRFTRQ